MHIDSYRHGRMVIDGRAETKDLIIAGGDVHPNWWRREGHLLSPEDLASVWEREPRLLIVGTGSTGRMQPTTSLVPEAARRGVELEILPTNEAVGRFNELTDGGDTEVAAAFHLTC